VLPYFEETTEGAKIANEKIKRINKSLSENFETVFYYGEKRNIEKENSKIRKNSFYSKLGPTLSNKDFFGKYFLGLEFNGKKIRILLGTEYSKGSNGVRFVLYGFEGTGKERDPYYFGSGFENAFSRTLAIDTNEKRGYGDKSPIYPASKIIAEISAYLREKPYRKNSVR
jgi:hypothetical protein